MFKNGEIEGVIIRPLKRFEDKRGWLSELFRADELPVEFIDDTDGERRGESRVANIL